MRILRKNCLLKKVGFSKSTLSNRLNPSSPYYDETFPKPFPIGLSILGWDESEVDTWLESQKNNSRSSPQCNDLQRTGSKGAQPIVPLHGI